MTEPTLTIGELAGRAGLAPSAIRYYERVGVLPPPARVAGRRRYGEDTVRRLGAVAVAKEAGFTLAEIRVLLASGAAGATLRTLAERKLEEVEALLARAAAMRDWLALARGCECPTVDACALLATPPAGAAR